MIRKIYADGSEMEFLKEVEKRSSETNEKVEATVREIIANVKEKGDKAVKEYTAKFDCPDCEYYEVPQEVINNALTEADPRLVDALLNCVEKITAFHEKQKRS